MLYRNGEKWGNKKMQNFFRCHSMSLLDLRKGGSFTQNVPSLEAGDRFALVFESYVYMYLHLSQLKYN